MSMYEEIQNGLKKEFERRKNLNVRYSLRAFAKSLDISVARLSEIMNGKRKPSRNQIEKINLSLGGASKLQFVNGSAYEHKKTFSQDQFEIISDWIYLAILSFLKESQKKCTKEYLADLFNKSVKAMDQVLNDLEKNKFIQKENNGEFRWIPGPEKTTDQIPSEHIMKFHLGALEVCKEKLKTCPVELRDFSSMTMTIDSRKIESAKREIKNFRRKLSAFLEEGTKDQVYALNIQFVPLSKKYKEME